MTKKEKPTTPKGIEVEIQRAFALALQTIRGGHARNQEPKDLRSTTLAWAPQHQPPKLYSPTTAGIALTGQGRLILSQALLQGGKGVSVEKLLPFADNEIEQMLVRLVQQANPDLLAKWEDPLEALFHFKVLHIPVICRRLLALESRNAKVGMLWLGALSAYSVAFERVLLERLFRALSQELMPHLKGKEMEIWATKKLGATTNNWFKDAPEGHLFWLFRFTQWRDYALRSLTHFFGQQSIDVRRMTGVSKEAAVLGVLSVRGDLPEERCSELIIRVRADQEARKVFLKNARRRSTNPLSIELDTFLIECWPVVLEYGWTYREVQLAANRRFEGIENIAKLIDTAPALKDRCARLGLSLSALGKGKVGRPKKDEESRLPVLAQVALLVDGLGGNPAEWFWGKTEAGFHSLQKATVR